MNNPDLTQIAARLEAIPQEIIIIQQAAWKRFNELRQPYWERMQRLRKGRASGRVSERAMRVYRQKLDACYHAAMVGMAQVDALEQEAAKLRTRRCELERTARKEKVA